MGEKYSRWLTPEGLEQLGTWSRMGLTDEQLAHNCGIRVSTLYRWKKWFPAFAEAIRQGREVVDLQVENALFKRALGFEYTEVTEEVRGGEMQPVKRVTKQTAPDVTAQIFWLKNRCADRWREKQEPQEAREITIKLTGELEEWSK